MVKKTEQKLKTKADIVKMLKKKDAQDVATLFEDAYCEHCSLIEELGGDGDGSSSSCIYEVFVSDNNDKPLLIRLDGYYSSYDSNSWYDAYFCKPVPVVVIQFHRDDQAGAA
jgi:hypothetical protein